MAGYTTRAIAGRIQKIDSLVNWKLYTALATLGRLSGTPKRKIEDMVFGAGEKPSKDFNNAWSRAGKVFARFYSGKLNMEAANGVRAMGIEEAEAEVLRVIDAHMTALGVKGKNAYDERIDYEDEAEWLAATTPSEPEPEPEPEPEAKDAEPEMVEAEVVAEEVEPDWDVVMAQMCRMIDRMPDDRLGDLAQYLSGVMTGRQTLKIAA